MSSARFEYAPDSQYDYAPGTRAECPLRSCPLWGSRIVPPELNPYSVAWLVGEAPGKDEEESGLPFVGKSGRELNMYLKRFTRIPRERFSVGNILRCRPPGNRDPHADEISHCESRLILDLDEHRPSIVAAVGRVSARWFLGCLVRMEKVHGLVFERAGRIIVPVYHPAAGLHSPRRMSDTIRDFSILGEVIRGERGITHMSEIQSEYGVG